MKKKIFKLRLVRVTTMRSKLFQTWSEEGKVEDETHQDEPGVRCWTVVISPDRAVSRLCLVKTPEIKTKVSNSSDLDRGYCSLHAIQWLNVL